MSIDPLTENAISLVEAAKLLPRRRAGKRPHVSCVYRWTTAGCKGVVLESLQIGGTRCTSKEALLRFFERLSAPQDDRQGAPPSARAKRREREIREAESRCKAAGI